MTSMKHKAANKISRLIAYDKILLKDNDIVRFFSNLLTGSKDIDIAKKQDLVDNIPKIIEPYQNKTLSAIPTANEIKKAIFSFQGDKALGPMVFP